MKIRILTFCFLSSLLSACTTTAPVAVDNNSVSLPTTLPSKPDVPNAPKEEVDLEQLQYSLNMRISGEELGYYEKPFNTCTAGAGFSTTTDCRDMYFVLVHYRLRCRDSEGTTSEVVTEADLTDIASSPMTWSLKNKEGRSETDNGGFGVVREVFTDSPRQERLKISDGKRFLFLKANQIRTAIVPKNWCEKILVSR